MTPVQPSGVALTSEGPAELFSSQSYAEWTRQALRVRADEPDLSILFDSTVSEPVEALAALTRTVFGEPVSSRYVSVFSDGNRFAHAALAHRYGLAPEQFLTTTGATSALALVFRALLQPGCEVLVERPGFDIHSRMVASAGARLATFERPAPDFGISLDAVLGRLTPQTKVVLITDLHNPSGVQLERGDLAPLARSLAEHGVVLVVDEVYADFAGAERPPPAASYGANVISISSLTKVFGLFSLKFGWLAAHPEMITCIRQATPDGDIGVSKLTHAIAAHVLEAPEAFERHWRRNLAATRAVVFEAAADLRASGDIEGDLPAFGCMYFPRVVGVADTLGLARRLYERNRVLVAPGEYFGAPGHIRIGFGADPQTIGEGLEKLTRGLRAR